MKMNDKEQEYREIFLDEALENSSEINRLLTVLEKDITDTTAIKALFRITHTLKGNAAGMGYEKIAEMAHVLEDFFCEVRDGRIALSSGIFTSIFKAADLLGELIEAIRTPRDVKYRGIKTKLEVMIRQGRQDHNVAVSDKTNQQDTTHAATSEAADSQPPLNTANSPSVEAGDSPETSVTPSSHSVNRDSAKQKSSTEANSPSVDGGASRSSDAHPISAASDDEDDHVASTSVAFSDLVQVPVKKLDNLLNLVGELVIERDRIIASNSGIASANEFSRLNRISSDLQYSVMDVRLVQVGFLFNKFHRIVRDAAAKENKQVRLRLEGTETEIDRNILQVISDSLIHLVRNCVGHGIELPAARTSKGKTSEGTVTLSASSESDTVFIRIHDDGAGIDPARIRQKAIEKGLVTAHDAAQLTERDIIMLIFEAGFSTTDQVTSISGRGVGMDVVRKALDSIGGTISVDSVVGEGTTITLRLPSSMAVKSTLLFELGHHTYAIPLAYTESVISIYKSDITRASNELVTVHLGNTIHIIFLAGLLGVSDNARSHRATFDKLHPEDRLEIVVVTFNGRRLGFIVDKLLQQKEIVEKPLKKPVDNVTYLSGTTIMGNGNVCLVLNIHGIINSLTAQSPEKVHNL